MDLCISKSFRKREWFAAARFEQMPKTEKVVNRMWIFRKKRKETSRKRADREQKTRVKRTKLSKTRE